MQTIGFIGCGNMGGAIAAAVCKTAQPQSVLLANRTPEKAAALAAMLAAVLLLCSCDTQAAYENLLHRLGGEPDAQPAAQTETEQTTQTETPAPVTATPNSALWPDGVPAPAACNPVWAVRPWPDSNDIAS